MKDNLTYRMSDEGERAFTSAMNAAKEWINDNLNGPLTLKFSISLKLSAPEGETVREIMATPGLPFKAPKAQRRECEDADSE